ncbi:hypothetical protein HJC23_000930 [Cyclotella cryptica]|uniref:Uncharacterized protein n=1 Tax=Cyclotella cryptica TaxID=29204 RepID=A0ABD3QM65_9STRA|eukprot:CCRYP_004028-RA/>CCRYP_004028-RA protein AED:0.23 eAED:0.23 QI:0/-1/0/1/-1/1/1/0/656
MSSPKPKTKKTFLFAKLGAKANAKDEALKPDAQLDATKEAPVADALDLSIENETEDGKLNKGEAEQLDVAPPAKSKHSFLPKKFHVSLGPKTKPNVEEQNENEYDAALNDASVDNEDEVVGSSKDWSVEINMGKTAKIADKEDSKDEPSLDRHEVENQVTEAVASSNPSEQPSDPPTNEGGINPTLVDTSDKSKEKRDDDDIDLMELKTKFMKMFRRKQKPVESAKIECKEEVPEGCDAVKSMSIEDAAGGEAPSLVTNDGTEDKNGDEGTSDPNIQEDDEIVDPAASDANFSKKASSGENSSKTATIASPTSKEELDGSREGQPGDAVKLDDEIKEANDAEPCSNDVTKSSSFKSKFKQIFKSNASSAKVTSGAIATAKAVDDVKECNINVSKSDLASRHVNDTPIARNDMLTNDNQVSVSAASGSKLEANVARDAESKRGKGLKSKIMKKLFRPDGEEAACSKEGETKNGDGAALESPPSKAEERGDSPKQLDKNSNLEIIPSNMLLEADAIKDESIVETEETNIPRDNDTANDQKNTDVPQAKDDATESKGLNVLKVPTEDGPQDKQTDGKGGTNNDHESDDESAKDDRQYEKQSRCGFGDGIHDALMHAGQLMYDTCGDPDFGTAKKMLGIMEIGENAMCHCLGTSPPDKDA